MQKICGLIIILIGIFITNITFAGGSHMFTFKSIDGEDTINPVSYTHLTLPTILLV